jgi:hypothetical protein
MLRSSSSCIFLLAAWSAMTPCAAAQTPINALGAMQPSTGTGIVHLMPMYRREGSDPVTGQSSADDWVTLMQVGYGVSKNMGLQFDVPMVYRDVRIGGPVPAGAPSPSEGFGVADSTALLKWRIIQSDPAPAETTRFSLLGGLQIPGDSGYTWDSSTDAWDPIIGAVFSTVRGRHGFNADAAWEFYTGGDRDLGRSDSLHFDASYLFRLSPAQYAADTVGALYSVLELNGHYDTNGDIEVFLSPGLMYEARKFTLDATVMIPVYQNVDFRAETEFLVGVGVRISF